jgi:hypothetical protein
MVGVSEALDRSWRIRFSKRSVSSVSKYGAHSDSQASFSSSGSVLFTASVIASVNRSSSATLRAAGEIARAVKIADLRDNYGRIPPEASGPAWGERRRRYKRALARLEPLGDQPTPRAH